MPTVFLKEDPLLTATMMAVLADPLPYTLTDMGDRVSFEIKSDVPPERAYRLGILSFECLKIVMSVLKQKKYSPNRFGSGRW
jgi:hypothetical protein